jgi:hypothetical protein
MIRDRILARIEEIKKTIGSDLFGDRFETGKKKGKIKNGGIWYKDQDFSILSEGELLETFERIVARAYQQRRSKV